MVKFVKLTRLRNNVIIYVNMDKVNEMVPADNNETILFFSESYSVRVKESSEKILAMIGQSSATEM